ncbi:MAG: ABC-three component system protein [Thermoanaerobaculia bacterium]
MIHRITSDLPSFKTIDLKPGLNIVVADKTEKSSSRNTRNSAGKSSLIEILNFLFGSDADAESLLRVPELAESLFSVTFDLSSQTVTASRRGVEHGRIYLDGEIEPAIWSGALQQDEESERLYITNMRWREVLGSVFFQLDKDAEEGFKKNRPSFRSLFSYFVRRHGDAGFQDANKHFKNQKAVDYQVNLSYLLHLDWRIAQEWQQVRDQEKSIDALRSALRQGTLGGEVIESSGKLRTQLTIAEKERDDLRKRLEAFRVIKDQERLEIEASVITQKINALADENSSDLLLIRELRESLAAEKPPPRSGLEQVYAQVGIELPGVVLQRFEAVARFHESVIQNRRTFLSGEITAAEQRLAKRRSEQSDLDYRRSDIMNVLQSSGALQQFSALQSELSRLDANVAGLRAKYDMAKQLESKKTELTMQRAKLSARLQHDLDERKNIVSEAILTFESISEELYEDPGSLTIDATENGPEFETIIQGKRSVGKNSMQIFCFDMTLAILNAGQRMPGFLIHDSHLFDGADERQIAKALAIGAQKAEQHGFQYIVTMNTDDLPSLEEFPEGFLLEKYVNDVRLTDATENGGLFGFRFG